MAGRLATIVVPVGVAASPDLTILPLGLAASAYGGGAVVAALAAFAATTLATFVVLRSSPRRPAIRSGGESLEDHANTITSLVLIAMSSSPLPASS